MKSRTASDAGPSTVAQAESKRKSERKTLRAENDALVAAACDLRSKLDRANAEIERLRAMIPPPSEPAPEPIKHAYAVGDWVMCSSGFPSRIRDVCPSRPAYELNYHSGDGNITDPLMGGGYGFWIDESTVKPITDPVIKLRIKLTDQHTLVRQNEAAAKFARAEIEHLTYALKVIAGGAK